ncbi:MAG TPA: hypothetical protein DCK95_05835 [Anaerolineaceae bacterium]|uniref:Uncharacterized protein n=1 Tax=Anaerolinea thermophila TaxID=167964 RepID=A0A124FN65_9CHLR|nr:MAG: hypothetical protein XD73_0140 [Anaerolinea thermophila]HAF61828.1 hypothetical protein [Anaerolineaceae bacterium]
MANSNKLHTLLKAPVELGWKSTWQYALYQSGLRSGYFYLRTPTPAIEKIRSQIPHTIKSILPLPNKQLLQHTLGTTMPTLLQKADAVTEGKFCLFEGPLTEFTLAHQAPLQHWSQFERRKASVDNDIKFIWEPARAGWAFLLARAFYLSGDDRYAQSFIQLFNQYQQENPPYHGPNWVSAQEAALRIMAFCFAYQVFSESEHFPTKTISDLSLAIALNAHRIPPTLCYARSQRNNHLISEAVGLYTAGLFLQGYPPARAWERKGKKVFEQAILDQIDKNGTYIQHSTNYHRLMLDEALWMTSIANSAGDSFSQAVLQKLALATQHLYRMTDTISGHVPNLGNQDGSNVLPLATADHLDYRASLQAASRQFLGKNAFEEGSWDEKSLWLNIKPQAETLHEQEDTLQLHSSHGWASLRAITYHARPAHADQLHVEIWHNGQNLALDAGTFLYNAPPPWQNALRTTLVHNTICIDRRDQMLAAGKFLWLDWANAEIHESTATRVTASHNGYKKMGINHTRTLSSTPKGWEVADELQSMKSQAVEHEYLLHWLIPDLVFHVQGNQILFDNPAIRLTFLTNGSGQSLLHIIRGGCVLHGESNIDPLLFGWFSPTYSVKQEALSVLYVVHSNLPLTTISSNWEFLK